MTHPTPAPDEALRALIAKLEFVHNHPRYKAVWECGHFRLGAYDGPTYTDELAAAKASLSPPQRSDAREVREALKVAISHIDHMAAWITEANNEYHPIPNTYSFESLGEDMPGLRAALQPQPEAKDVRWQPSTVGECLHMLATVTCRLEELRQALNVLEKPSE